MLSWCLWFLLVFFFYRLRVCVCVCNYLKEAIHSWASIFKRYKVLCSKNTCLSCYAVTNSHPQGSHPCFLFIFLEIFIHWQAKVFTLTFKQEMASVNVDILGISRLKWTGMGEFNSDDHYIYYCGQESLRRNGVAIMVNKRVRNAVLGCNLKNDRMISVRFQGKPFNIAVIQVYAPTSNAEEAEVERFYEDLQDLLELTPKKDVLFIWTGTQK